MMIRRSATRSRPGSARRVWRRTEVGATTAEYVGIVAVVALLVVALFTLNNPFAERADGIISRAFCKIGEAFGGGGCENADLPGYVPTDCTLSSQSEHRGGEVSIVASVGGDTGYTILRVRERIGPGQYRDRYIVKTSGQVSGSYEFGPGGGVQAGDKEAGAGATVTVNGEIETGQTFHFDSLAEAQEFADKNKNKFGGVLGTTDGVEPESTYYQAGGGAEVRGEAGPLSGSAGGQAVLGVETHRNGDTTFNLALTASAAADLGLPIPDTLLEAQASGDLSLGITAAVRFDKDGNLVSIASDVSGVVEVEGGIGFGDRDRSQDTAGPNGTKGKPNWEWELPGLPELDAGGTFNLAFSTSFRDEDGNLDYSGAQGISDSIMSFVTGNGIDQDAADAVRDQLVDNSQVTFTVGTYDKDTDTYGGKVKIIAVTIGGEYRVVTVNENTTGGWYLNPTTGAWEENLACEA